MGNRILGEEIAFVWGMVLIIPQTDNKRAKDLAIK